MDRQTLPRVLVEDGQHPQLPTALGACFQKIIGPHLIRVAGTPQIASGVTIAPFDSFSAWQLQPFLPPDAVHPLAIDRITVVLEHGGDDPVAIHRLLVSIFADEARQFRLHLLAA